MAENQDMSVFLFYLLDLLELKLYFYIIRKIGCQCPVLKDLSS